MAPKISVIIPIYNNERYLHECLDSVVNQSLRDIEILCINDGSTDGSPAILEEFAQRDNRIRILAHTNAGYGVSMNRGIDEAIGEYVAVVESDDCVNPDMFQALYDIAEKTDADVVKADYLMFGDDSSTYCQIAPDKRMYGHVMDSTQTTALFYAIQMTWEGIYKRSFLLENSIRHNTTPGASFQDNGFWFQVFAFAKRVVFVNEAYYMYRISNPDSSVRQTNKEKLYLMFDEYDFIRDFLDAHPACKERLFSTYVYFRLDNILSRYFHSDEAFRYEFALRLKEEYRMAKESGADMSLLTPLLRGYFDSVTADPLAFSKKEQISIDEACWTEVEARRTSDKFIDDVAIPPQIILPYCDMLENLHG